jgi:hypothetical protein
MENYSQKVVDVSASITAKIEMQALPYAAAVASHRELVA